MYFWVAQTQSIRTCSCPQTRMNSRHPPSKHPAPPPPPPPPPPQTVSACLYISELYCNSNGVHLWLQHAQPTIPQQLRHSVAPTCSVNYTTATQALCGCNMLSQLYHSNSGTLWLQHAQSTIPQQLRHSVAATCSVNYTTATQALCGCNMLSQLYHSNSGTLWLQHAQSTIPHQLRQ